MASGSTDKNRFLVTAIPYLWLIVFFLVPFFIVFKISLSSTAIALPPYTPTLDPLRDGLTATLDRLGEFTGANYRRLIGEIPLPPVIMAFLLALAVTATAFAAARAVAALRERLPGPLGLLVLLAAWLPFLAVAAAALLVALGAVPPETTWRDLPVLAGVSAEPWRLPEHELAGFAFLSAAAIPAGLVAGKLGLFGTGFAVTALVVTGIGVSAANLLEGAGIYLESYLTSLWIAAVATFLTLLVGYPIAYGMARAPKSIRPTLLMMVILPFWTSFLIRVYAWIGILSNEGLLNSLLMSLGIIEEPLTILSTSRAVYIGIVYSYLPFMILPLYAALEKMDDTLIEAAQDLGCTPLQAFWRVTFPLSLPGVVAGSALVFIPVVGEFVIPDLLGGSDVQMIGKTLWEEFFANRDWPVASAVAITLLMILVIPIVIFQNAQAKAQEAGR